MSVRDAGERRPPHGRAAREAGGPRARGQRVRITTATARFAASSSRRDEGELSWDAPARRHRRGRPRGRARARPARRPDRARRAAGGAAERPRALRRARRPGRDLRRARGAAAGRRRPARRGTSRSSSSGRRRPHARRRARDRAALAPDVAIVVEVTYAGDAPGTAPVGATSSSAAGRPSSAVRSSARSSATACSTSPPGPASRWRSSPGRPTAQRRRRRLHGRRRDRLRDRLHPAALHAHGRGDRAALGRRRRLPADRGVRTIARRRDSFLR